MNIKEQVSVLWTLVVIILICLIFIILFRIKAPQETNQMCFTNEEGDLRNGVLDYCKYLDNDCYRGFLNWSGGNGLYWKDEFRTKS